MSNHSIDNDSLRTEVEYRDVPGFPGYRVGSDGSVWSQWEWKGKGKGKQCSWSIGKNWRRLSSYFRRYCYLTLVRDGKKFTRTVHTIVLLAFVGPRPASNQARHLDGNPQNNRLSNLCWGTPGENGADKVRHGRSLRGGKNIRALLTEDAVRDIKRRLRRGEKGVAIAREVGVSQATISAINVGRIWKHLE